MRRLGKHSAVYGLGGIVSRLIAVFLLPVYTRYLDPDDFGAVGVLVALSAVLVTILRAGISSAFFRFWFDSQDAARRLLVLRTSFWFTMASATAGLAAGWLLASPISDALEPRRPVARSRRLRRHLGADELRAADRRLPRRGAVGPLRPREPHQHRDHRRHERDPDRRLRAGRARPDRRQLHRHADGLPRPARLPPRTARPLVLARAAARDEPLRRPARAGRARADRDEPRRPLLPRPLRGDRGGRPLRDRRPDRVGDGAPDHGVQDRVAGVRVLDRRRRRGEAHLRLRAHVPGRDRVVARARARRPLSLARAAARHARVLRGRPRRRAARVRAASPTPRTS